MKVIRIISALIWLAFWSCQEEINKPVLQTFDVSGLTDQGVTFNGKITFCSVSNIDNYGFVWSTRSVPVAGADSTYYFNKAPVAGRFSLEVNNDLIAGSPYYVRFFLKSSQEIFYANTVQFTSLGSAGPVITDFNPKAGSAETSVAITGDHFSESISANTVKIGPTVCPVVSASRTKLAILIPATYQGGSYPVTVTSAGQTAQSSGSFLLQGPVISSLLPTFGPAGTVLTITGSGFSPAIANDSVLVGGKSAVITHAGSTQLVVSVPVNSVAGQEAVVVKVDKVTAPLRAQFTLTGPVITSFSPAAGLVGSQLTITGTGFSSDPTTDLVLIGGTPAVVVSASPQQLVVTIPQLSVAGTAAVVVTVKSITVVAQNLFNLQGPQITSFSPAAQYGGRAIILTGQNFGSTVDDNVVLFNNNLQADVLAASTTALTVQVPFDLIVNSPITVIVGAIRYTTTNSLTLLSPFTSQPNFPGGTRYGASGFTIGSYGYVGMGIGNSTDRSDLWQFDPSNNTWTKKSDCPRSRAFSFSFVINGKAYIGGGGHYGGSSYDLINVLTDLWEYDPQTDTWAAKAAFPLCCDGNNPTVSATAIGSYGYVVTPFNSSQYLCRYNPVEDEWNTSTFPAAAGDVNFASTIGGKGYFAFGYDNNTFWEYDPATTSWTQLPDFPEPQGAGPLFFTVNSKVYAGGSAFFYFDPSTQTWARQPSVPLTFGSTACFTVNNMAYFATGVNGQSLNFFYSFNPSY